MAVQGAAYASNTIHDYEFSWTIDHFSLSPDQMRGPSFSPIPGFLETLCIELQCKQCFSPYFIFSLELSLLDLNVKDRNLTVSSRTSFRNCNDYSSKDATISSTEFKGSIPLLGYSYSTNSKIDFVTKKQISDFLYLYDDKLVVKGKLSFSDYDIASSVSSLIVENGSEASGELVKDFKTMYESGSTSDITFSVGEKTLRAHKNILLSRSPVFAKMFDSDMSESNSNNVDIEDADSHAFNCFLVFLYTGIVEDKKRDTVLSLYSLAHKYQVNSLHAVCSGILGNSLTTDYACSVLVLSDLHGDKKLKKLAKFFIRCHIFKIAGTAEWSDIIITKPELVKETLS